jgi:hypothetical protein
MRMRGLSEGVQRAMRPLPPPQGEGTLSEGIKLLKQLQDRMGLNDAQFARTLGISKALLSRIYSGQCQMGLKVWRGLVCAFPGQKDRLMVAYVLAGGSLVHAQVFIEKLVIRSLPGPSGV